MAILLRPSPAVDLEPMLRSGSNGALDENVVKHRKAILDGASAKAEGIHKTGRQYGGVAGVAEAEDSLQSGKQFQTIGAGKGVPVDQHHFVSVE